MIRFPLIFRNSQCFVEESLRENSRQEIVVFHCCPFKYYAFVGRYRESCEDQLNIRPVFSFGQRRCDERGPIQSVGRQLAFTVDQVIPPILIIRKLSDYSSRRRSESAMEPTLTFTGSSQEAVVSLCVNGPYATMA